MSAKRWPSYARMSRGAGRRRNALPMLAFLLVVSIFAAGSLFLRSLSTELAVSMAQDAVSGVVGGIVKEKMSTARAEYGSLIVLEKNAAGEITAVTTDVASLNTLAGDIVHEVANATTDHDIDVSIPLGSLTGSALLLSRGPHIKVRVQVLSSTFSGFNTDIVSIGINQTRHQITLQLREELTLLMPWRAIDTEVITDIPVAETIIVGQVPQSYLNMGE